MKAFRTHPNEIGVYEEEGRITRIGTGDRQGEVLVGNARSLAGLSVLRVPGAGVEHLTEDVSGGVAGAAALVQGDRNADLR